MSDALAPSLRIARFAGSGSAFYALLEDDGRARELTGDPFALSAQGAPGTEIRKRLVEAARGASRPTGALRWLPPAAPSKIIGVGRNYRAHAEELGHALPTEPLLFLKPSSAALEPGGTVELPRASARVDYEGELGLVIGRRARRVTEERALEHVLGYTCVNDITARDLQQKDVQFTRAKGFDGFCPFGPCVAVGLDPRELRVETFVNGARRQSAAVAQMIFGPARLVSYISHIMTLHPGDLIATGTPEGVGPLRPGDEVAVSIEGIGRLVTRVAAAAD